MTEAPIEWHPDADFFRVVCRLGELLPDGPDAGTRPDLTTKAGTVTISSTAPGRILVKTEADGHDRIIGYRGDTYDVSAATGELVAADRTVGLQLLSPTSDRVKPQGYPYTATIKLGAGGPSVTVTFDATPTHPDGTVDLARLAVEPIMDGTTPTTVAQQLAAMQAQIDALVAVDPPDVDSLATELTTRLEAPGAVGFQPIAGAPTYVAGRRILGVVGGALYSSPTTADSRIDRLDGDTWTPVATASGEGHMVRIYGTGDGEIIVNRSQSMWKSAGWGAPDVTFSQVVEVRPPGHADRSQVRFHQGWGIDVRGQYIIATEYGPWSTSRYAWLSSDNGTTFQQVFDFHDHPGGSTPNPGGAHLHGVAINLRDQTMFVIGGDAAAAGIYWAKLSNPTQWSPLAHQPTSSMGHKSIPTTIRETRWGMTLGSDNDPNGVWHIPHSSDHDYRLSFHLVFPFGQASTQLVAQHIHEDEWGVAWHLFSGAGARPNYIVAFSGLGAYSVVLEDQNKRIFGANEPHTIFAHASRLWVTDSGGGYYVFARPHAGTPAPVVRDSGATLGGTANPDGSALAAGINAKAPGLRSVAVGAAVATGVDAVAIGRGASAQKNHSVAIGPAATANLETSVAIGLSSTATGVAVGYGTRSAFHSAVALGYRAICDASDSIAIGYDAATPNNSSAATAIGASSSAAGNGTAVGRGAAATFNAVAIGTEAKGEAGESVAVGRQAEATHSGSVALGHQTKTTATGQVAVGGRDVEVQDATKGLVLRSPDGSRWRATINNAGVIAWVKIV